MYTRFIRKRDEMRCFRFVPLPIPTRRSRAAVASVVVLFLGAILAVAVLGAEAASPAAEPRAIRQGDWAAFPMQRPHPPSVSSATTSSHKSLATTWGNLELDL